MAQLAMNYVCYLSHTDPLTNIQGSCLFGWWVQHDKIMSCQVDKLMKGNMWHEYMIFHIDITLEQEPCSMKNTSPQFQEHFKTAELLMFYSVL